VKGLDALYEHQKGRIPGLAYLIKEMLTLEGVARIVPINES